MPWSSDEGKDFSRSTIAELTPRTVLDVGPGAGTYGRMIRDNLPSVEMLDAVEIFKPYITKYGLHDIYDNVVAADIVEFVDVMSGDDWWYDLIILGDVLEHLEHPTAVSLVEDLRKHCKYILLSLPIVEWEQGALEGNEHETHLHHWSDDEVEATFEPYLSQVGEQIGVYLIKGSEDERDTP